MSAAIRWGSMYGEQMPVYNSIDADVRNAIQAQIINGDIHIHGRLSARVPHQLPGSIGELVNQYRVLTSLNAVDEQRHELGEPSIAVLLGPRGSGKSTVATYWSHQRIETFPDGQLYASLGAWSEQPRSPSEVLGDFLLELGVSLREIPADLAARQALFRSRTYGGSYLVVLEDVASAAQVRALLPGAGRSMVVVTGHGAFASLAPLGARMIDLDPLEDEMVDLLLRRFAGDRIDAEPAVRREVLAWCAGLPIAVCVAGALLAEFPGLAMAELMAEIRAEDGGLADYPVDGERTLGSLFDAVYRRLGPSARRCYRAIGLFPGRSDIAGGALRAAAGLDGLDFQRALRELATVRVVERAEPDRLVVHGLVRDHGGRLARLPEVPPEQGQVYQRMIQWYVDGAVAADSKLMPQRGMREHLFPDLAVDAEHSAGADAHAWMETNRVMLRDVVSVAHQRGDADSVVRLCVALWSSYEPGKYFDDLLVTHELGIKDARRTGQRSALALLLVQTGFAHLHHGQPERALVVAEEAVAQASAAADRPIEATAVEHAGLAALAAGDQTRARGLLERNLAMAREIGVPRRIALACLHLAKATDARHAPALLDEALRLFRALPALEPWNIAKVYTCQGRWHGVMGEFDKARRCLTDALALFEESERVFDMAQVLDDLGDLAVRGGDTVGAAGWYSRALDIYQANGFLFYAVHDENRLAALT